MSSSSSRYTKSWMAYVMPGVGLFILLLVGLFVLISGVTSLKAISEGTSVLYVMTLFGVGASLWLLMLGYSIIRILAIRSFVLYTDEAGVWVHSGVFPWSKGRNGVRWSDIDSASYYTGFLSWLFGSYTIRIDHRYTKSNELKLTHIARGNEAVGNINGTLERGAVGATSS